MIALAIFVVVAVVVAADRQNYPSDSCSCSRCCVVVEYTVAVASKCPTGYSPLLLGAAVAFAVHDYTHFYPCC